MKLYYINDGFFEYCFECPGCGSFHGFRTPGYLPRPDLSPRDQDLFRKATWSFDGNLEEPTIKPSIVSHGSILCHFVVTSGKIFFCLDSQHELAGKIIEMIKI